MPSLPRIIFYTLWFLFLFNFGQVTSVRRKHGPSLLFSRLLNEFLKLKQFELHHSLPQKRNRISSVLESIIKEDEAEESASKIVNKKFVRPRKKVTITEKKGNVPEKEKIAPFTTVLEDFINRKYRRPYKKATIAANVLNNPQPGKGSSATSAVESITFTAPQLKKVKKTEMDKLLQRMEMNSLQNKETPKTFKKNDTKTLAGELQKKHVVVNDAVADGPLGSLKIGDKDSDNPHPRVSLNTNKFNTIYSQAHEGNNTGDDDLEDLSKIKEISAANKINPNPRPNTLRSKLDPLHVVSHRITNEDDMEKPDKSSGHGNTSNKKQDNVDSKLVKKLPKITKPPDNKSLATQKEDKESDPLRQKKMLGAMHRVKNSKLPRVQKKVNPDNWADRKTHALAILAKIASDLDQQDVVENVMSALGITDIIKLDHSLVQHDEMDSSDDFGRDKNWVDEELGENSGSGEILPIHDLGKKEAVVHEVQVIRENFVKGQPKDKISGRKRKGENYESDLGNLVDD